MSNGSGGMHRVGRWHKVKLPQLGPPTCLQIHGSHLHRKVVQLPTAELVCR
jgi:hypothetical protein